LLHAKTDALRDRIGASAVPISEVPFVVGRIALGAEEIPSRPADLLIEDNPPFRLSRQHFMITRSGEQLLVADLGSALGTIVNGQPIGHHFKSDAAPLSGGENDVLAGGRGSLFEFIVSVT
jgi:pSer/pThr/pTyr-binding forkhead associated (FHA) protein